MERNSAKYEPISEELHRVRTRNAVYRTVNGDF